MGLNGSATTTMVFAERANEDGKAEGQGTEGHRPKAWPEHTLPPLLMVPRGRELDQQALE